MLSWHSEGKGFGSEDRQRISWLGKLKSNPPSSRGELSGMWAQSTVWGSMTEEQKAPQIEKAEKEKAKYARNRSTTANEQSG